MDKCPLAFEHLKVKVYHSLMNGPGTRPSNHWYTFREESNPDLTANKEFDARELPGYKAPVYNSDAPFGSLYTDTLAENERVIRLALERDYFQESFLLPA